MRCSALLDVVNRKGGEKNYVDSVRQTSPLVERIIAPNLWLDCLNGLGYFKDDVDAVHNTYDYKPEGYQAAVGLSHSF